MLNKLPKGPQAQAKANLDEIWMAESRVDAEAAFDHFLATYAAKYPKATECLAKDRDTLLTFYDFPAEHWQHIRTTNPIESTAREGEIAHRQDARLRYRARVSWRWSSS